MYRYVVYVLAQESEIIKQIIQQLEYSWVQVEALDVEYLETAEQVTRASNELRSLIKLPHLVLFDERALVFQSSFLNQLKAHKEITKALMLREQEPELLQHALEVSGVDQLLKYEASNVVVETLQKLLHETRPYWSEDGLLPLRLHAGLLQQQLNQTQQQAEALAQANMRSIESFESLHEQFDQVSQRETSMRRVVHHLLGGEHHISLMQGSLATLSGLDLLRFCNTYQQSCLITFLHKGTQGAASVWQGELLYATTEEQTGAQALAEIFSWGWGEFFVQPIDAPTHRNVYAPTEQLLYEEQSLSVQHPSMLYAP